MPLNFIQSSELPTRWGTFKLHGFFDDIEKKAHIVLTLGSVSAHKSVLVRIHSEC